MVTDYLLKKDDRYRLYELKRALAGAVDQISCKSGSEFLICRAYGQEAEFTLPRGKAARAESYLQAAEWLDGLRIERERTPVKMAESALRGFAREAGLSLADDRESCLRLMISGLRELAVTTGLDFEELVREDVPSPSGGRRRQ